MEVENEMYEKKFFAEICYLVLMQELDRKAPSYINEKISIRNAGYDAFAYLDNNNQKIVLEYYRIWRLDLPKEIIDYISENI